MKRFLPLFIAVLALVSCQDDVRFSNPGLQALKDDVLWRGNDVRAYVSGTGELTIEAYTEYELLTLNTTSTTLGKYALGTTNSGNFASYTSSFNDMQLEYGTVAVPGPVSTISLNNRGTGYVSAQNVATTGGSGSGLTVDIVADANGMVTGVTIVTRGNNYMAGDLVTVAGGNVNCKVKVENVQNSNGEIEITEFDNIKGTVSGKFKFNATKTSIGDFGGPILNFFKGEFYKIRIYPSI